jgi:glycosyltransferase involved in cell wall biosynthesis
MAKTRVVFSIGAMHGGGSERQIVHLVNHLDRREFEPFLYLVYRTGPLLSMIPKDVQVVSFEERVSRTGIYLPGRMHSRRVHDFAAYLKEVRADVSYDRTFLMTLISAAGAQKIGVPNISTIVTDPETGFAPVAGRFQWLKRRMLHRLYNRSTRVLAVSEGARASAIRFYDIRPDRIETHRNGVDTAAIQALATVPVENDWWNAPARWAAARRIRLVSAGRLNHQKGFHHLVNAAAELRRRDPQLDLRVAILGDGSHRDVLQRQIDALEMADFIRLPGFQTNAPAWFQSADLFVLPSLIEGMPNVLLEAMSCGTPVVSTDCHSGPREILNSGTLGELVAVDSSNALVDGIQRILADPEAARSRAARARSIIESEWSIQSATKRLEEFLRLAARSGS